MAAMTTLMQRAAWTIMCICRQEYKLDSLAFLEDYLAGAPLARAAGIQQAVGALLGHAMVMAADIAAVIEAAAAATAAAVNQAITLLYVNKES